MKPRLRALLALAVLAALSNAAAAQPAPTGRPNILLILADDLGYGDLGCYGHPVIKTPRLDRLAKEGVRFTDCYAAMPVCSPSRAALLTGRNPHRLGIHDWIPAGSGIFMKTEEVTLAELLRDAGYRTAFSGKWHLNSRFNGQEPTPGDHGFDHWLATQNNANPSHENLTNFVRNRQRVGPVQGNSSKVIVDEALSFLDASPAEKPFFVCVWFHATHEPVDAPAEYEARYAQVEDPSKREYYGCVEYMDAQIGRLLDALDERKLADNTLVFFTSDNGPETLGRYKNGFRSHGSPGNLRGMKLHVYEGGIRVPGIARLPGKIKRSTECREPVCAIDFFPTAVELSGAKLPPDLKLDGTSLLPLLRGEAIARRAPLYWQYDQAIGGPMRFALRDGAWKLLADASQTKFELYNLSDDPGEKQDLSSTQPERIKQMFQQMRRTHAEVNADRNL